MIEKERLAIIDLGTNTFHLLIVEKSNTNLGFKELERKRHYVYLAEGGIDTISERAIQRAADAVDNFKVLLKKYKRYRLSIVGTEALRVASNGDLINSYVYDQLGKDPKVISGIREAELIYKGNRLIVNSEYDPYLIMDIGGGSTEFILANSSGVIYSNSYPLGVTKMYNIFNDSDPISSKAVVALESHVEEVVTEMTEFIQSFNIESLIGASGSFEVLSSVLKGKISNNELVDISIPSFQELSIYVLKSNFNERMHIQGLPEKRVKLVQVAFVMMRKIISMYKPSKISVSPFAIKEGIISEWINNDV